MTISTQLDGLKEFRFKAVLDSKDIEAIKAEQKTLKEDYEQHLSSHKEALKKLLESETSILSNHRDELKEIMRGESVWLSFKAWVWAILIVFALLIIAFCFGFFMRRRSSHRPLLTNSPSRFLGRAKSSATC